VCQELAARDSRVKLVEQAVNVGPVRNFRAVLEAATGELFMWLGDDDWLDPDYVGTCARLLAESDDTSVVAGVAINYQDGREHSESAPTNTASTTPVARVIDYYRTVEENAIFYGVMRRSSASRCVFPNTLAGDWLLVAQLAFCGALRTTTETRLHRERRGSTSQDTRRIVEILQLPSIQGVFPGTAIAAAAAKDVLRPGSVFDQLPAMRRTALAAAVGATVMARMGMKQTRRMAASLIGRDRAKRWSGVVRSFL
jgi:hypothetical protein